ncbi:MAG: monovalent cation/H+ antiporter complex subunit F [Alphaproteobacteria bacterium]|nr:monovalent cation/H+ antiporter complex subunit F [Alphaproteobacteria bacterium]
MFAFMSLALLVALVFSLFRALRGPTVFDRALASNSIGTGVTLLLIVVGFLNERPDFIDVSLTLALLNFVSTLAFLKFWRHGDLSHVGEEPVE